MTKDEVIQKLLDQINNINTAYITIISVVLVLVTIAFSVLFWLQIRLSKEQYSKMKEEAKNELEDEYKLSQIDLLKKNADFRIKKKAAEFTMMIAYYNHKGDPIPISDQFYFINVFGEVINGLDSVIKDEDKKHLRKMVKSASESLLKDDRYAIESDLKNLFESYSTDENKFND